MELPLKETCAAAEKNQAHDWGSDAMTSLCKRLCLAGFFLMSACAGIEPTESTVSAPESGPDCENHQGHMPISYAEHESQSKNDEQVCPSESDASDAKKQSFQSVRSVCKGDIAKLCGDVTCKDLMKPTQVCLMMDAEKLSADCKKALNRHISEHQTGIRPLE